MVASILFDRTPTRLAEYRVGRLEPVWPSGAAAVLALPERGCRWPIGEVADPGFRFCGAPRVARSYCAAHRAVAVVGGHR